MDSSTSDRDDKFNYQPGDLVITQCAFCRHLAAGSDNVCAAFPGQIPPEILANQHDHRRPWIDPETGEPGDKGVPLEHSILFDPRPGASRESLEALDRHFRES